MALIRPEGLVARLAVAANGSVDPNDLIHSNEVPLAGRSVPVIVLSVILVVTSTLWTALRIYCRWAKAQSWAAEDLLTLLALMTFYGLVSCNFVGVFLGGVGHHQLTLQPFHILCMRKATYAIQFLFPSCLGLVKISMTTMLHRLFCERPFKIAAKITTGLCVCWIVFTILNAIFICHPVAKNWNPSRPGGRCGNQKAACAVVGILDLATNLVIILLPAPMVHRLQLRRPHKVALYMIFGAGMLTMVFGILRLYHVLNVDSDDVAYSQVPVYLYSTLEAGLAVMVCSSPVLQHVFDATIGQLWSIRPRNSTHHNHVKPVTMPCIGGGGGGSSSAASRFSRNAGFNQIRPNTATDNLELTGMPHTRHDVAITAVKGHWMDSTEMKEARIKGDDMSGSEVGILVTDNTTVVSEPMDGKDY